MRLFNRDRSHEKEPSPTRKEFCKGKNLGYDLDDRHEIRLG